MADDRRLYVLCDTNAAVRDAHLFRKRGGPILVAMLRAKKAKLLVPEVLRMEYINQFILAGDEALQKATKELDKLKTFCGYDMSGLPPGSPLVTEVEIALQSTGVVSGEYGMAEAYEKKRLEVMDWLQDPDDRIRNFALKYTSALEAMRDRERERAEESTA